MCVFVAVPIVQLDQHQMAELEVDVLEQILTSPDMLEVGGSLEELVKVSLCYTLDPSLNGICFNYDEIMEHLTASPRCAKYYFQPDQREATEVELMRRVPTVARRTKAFA